MAPNTAPPPRRTGTVANDTEPRHACARDAVGSVTAIIAINASLRISTPNERGWDEQRMPVGIACDHAAGYNAVCDQRAQPLSIT